MADKNISDNELQRIADRSAANKAFIKARNQEWRRIVMQLNRLQDLMEIQAEDEGLWFVAETSAEAYLQEALRKLHRAIEDNE